MKALGYILLGALMGGLPSAEAQIADSTNAASFQNPRDLSYAGKLEHATWAEMNKNIRDIRAEDQKEISRLKDSLLNRQQDAESAKKQIEALKSTLLAAKKQIPKDPWREIHGHKQYVPSFGSGFERFSGKITEASSDGVHVLGKIGNSGDEEFIVTDYPYPAKVGESVDPAAICVAFREGIYKYVTEDGYAKSIPKLNYGKVSGRPPNADELERAAQQLTPVEESEVQILENRANSIGQEVKQLETSLASYLEDSEARQTKLKKELASAQAAVLNRERLSAESGNWVAMRRMGERYRDGDGVDVDLSTSEQYFQMADKALDSEANRIQKENEEKQWATLKLKFARNVELADMHENVEAMLYVEKCYRFGIGTDVNLDKAEEYHHKAVSAGIPKAPNRLL
jgi:hypothetical protein